MPDAAPAPAAGAGRCDAAVRRILCIVVTYNRREVLLRCVDRIVRKVAVPPGYQVDVLVVDNDSADGSRDAVRARFPAVEVVNTGGNFGGSGAFRTGLRIALDRGYDLVWLHDNDAFSSRRLLEHYVGALARLGGEAIVGGSMHQLEAPRRINEAGGFFGRSRNLDIHLPLLGQRSTPRLRRAGETVEVDYLAFANVLMPAAIVRRIGLPADLFLHYDDIEFCLRARAAGYAVAAVPAAVFWHESWLAKPKTWMQYYDTRNSLWAFEMRMPDRLRRKRLIWMLSAARNLAAGRPALAAAILAGVRDQACGITGRVEVSGAGFAVHDIATGGIEPLLAAGACRRFAVDQHALQALPRAYRTLWLGRLAELGERAFLCRLSGSRFTLHPAAPWVAEAAAGHSPRLTPALAPADARRTASETLLVRSALRTGVRARVALRAFRRIEWLHGTHVVAHDHGARAADYRRLGALWLRSWVWVARGRRRGR
jgi:GT2 family glycosyltransferase